MGPAAIVFQHSAVVHKVLVTPCVISMQIWFILSRYLAISLFFSFFFLHPFAFISLCFPDLSCLINFLEVTLRDLLYVIVCFVFVDNE